MPESLHEVLAALDSVLHYELFKINNTAITFASLAMFVIVVFAFFVISRFFNRSLLRRLLGRLHITEGTQFMMRRVSHYLIMILGVVVILLGFALMAGGGSDDPKIFNSEIYSFRRIRLAPTLVLLGLAIEVYAIMASPGKEQ